MYYVVVDLEKVPRAVVQWAVKKLGIEEWSVRVVMAMYEDTTTQVRVNARLSDELSVKVGVHQGSILSPLLLNHGSGSILTRLENWVAI